MLIVANWKMNCLKAEAQTLISAVKSAHSGKNDVVICPPFTIISTASELIKSSKIQLGAQDCGMQEKGAFTGDISADMLKDMGAKYVIVGHSERRKYHNETNELVKNKALAAIKTGLTPIICIGESLEERKSNQTEKILINQMENSLPEGSNYIIAYEPLWAIGTGVNAKSEEIEAAHKLISSKKPNIKILYGGSVNDQNCAEICSIANVSGLLVGGASIDATKFAKIIEV